MSGEQAAVEAPVMLRADITRDELAALKIAAIQSGVTVQQLLALLIRARLQEEKAA